MRQRYFFACLLMLLASACQAVGGQNPAATLEANNNVFLAEATNLAMTANANGTQVMATAQVIQTQVMQVNTVNQHLLATVIAGSSPTPRVVVGNADPSSSNSMPTGGGQIGDVPVQSSDGSTVGAQFTQIGTASSVRNSDGCADGLQNQFSSDASQIYITAQAFNLPAGTMMSAEWSSNGTVLVTNSPWTVDQNYDDICVWFFISQEDTPFTPGEWSARLLANNVPIEPAASFTIVGQ